MALFDADDSAKAFTSKDAAFQFMQACGLDPTRDAVDQLSEVFLPCLRIMCERPWAPDGTTWRASGQLGVLADLRKKFERVWRKYWLERGEHPDSLFDMINYAGFVHRQDVYGWNEWGEPGSANVDSD